MEVVSFLFTKTFSIDIRMLTGFIYDDDGR